MKNINEFGEYLRRRAHWTHDIIEKSAMYRLGIMEETITDMHLFSIADEFSDNILTKKFNRREEGAKSGADWLWIIGEPGSWLPLLVQAKIINPLTGNCQYLDYKNGEQRKRLLSYARQQGFVPLYCIYSMISPQFVPSQVFMQDKRSTKDWACSFVTPRTIRLFSNTGIKDQRTILKYAIPWMEPFCYSNTTQPNGQSIAETIEDIRNHSEKEEVHRAHRLKGKTLNQQKTSLQKRTQWENLDAVHAVKEKLPKSICKLFAGQSPDFHQIPFSGASIISSVPIKQISELNM